MLYKKATLDELHNYSLNRSNYTAGYSKDRPPFADEIGFHYYGDLRLNLKLSAADDTQNAQKYLQILQVYLLHLLFNLII